MVNSDPQRHRVYSWERAFVPRDRSIKEMPRRPPFPPQFIEYYETVWHWCVERFQLQDNWESAPPIRRNLKMTRMRGYAGLINTGGDTYRWGIKLGWPAKDVLLHEIAHLIDRACNGNISPLMISGHGPEFCRIALDLYIEFLGVDECDALSLADQHKVAVASK